jgi:hypothetical protein
MILLEPAHKILHTTVKFKRRTISVTPFCEHYDAKFGSSVGRIVSELPTIQSECRSASNAAQRVIGLLATFDLITLPGQIIFA